jgi:pilus assembly protein CpaE
MTSNPLVLILVLGLLVLVLLGALVMVRRRRTTKSTAPKKQKSGKRPAKKKVAAAPKKSASPKKVAARTSGPAPAAAAANSAPPAQSLASQPLAATDIGTGDKIRILVVDDNPDTRGHVSRLLYFEDDIEVIAQATNGRQGIEMAAELKPHIVLMDINMPDVDGIEATQEMSVKAPFSQVIIMTVQAEQYYMKQAMAAGARDFQPKPFTSEELVSCVRRVYNFGRPIYEQLAAAEQAEIRQEAKAKIEAAKKKVGTPVIAVYSPKGGIGASTVAANLAVALQRAAGDVVLMDADFQFGDVLVHLNTRPTRTVADVIHEEGLDLELLGDVILPHSSGLRLLLGPPQPELADAITPEMVARMITHLRDQYGLVLIDTSSKLDDRIMAVLENVDYILLLTSPELPAIKSAKLFLELCDQLQFDRDKIWVTINSANQSGGVPPSKIEKILKLDWTYRVPYDPRVLPAVNRGIVLTQQEPNSPMAQAIIQIADEINRKFVQPHRAEPVPEQI